MKNVNKYHCIFLMIIVPVLSFAATSSDISSSKVYSYGELAAVPDHGAIKVNSFRICSYVEGQQMRNVEHNFEYVDVTTKDFGAAGDGITDDTVAVQAALDSGRSVRVIGTTLVNNLVMSVPGQRIYGSGQNDILVKNANGVLLTVTGRDSIVDVAVRGDSVTPVFTGDNILITANNVQVKKGSFWAFRRAIRSTGNHTVLLPALYQTADLSETGYDIEIGTLGTATLYHELIGVYSSQHSGGILLTDTGSQSIIGGQFGKLTIQSGTSPAGVNGGKIVGARVTGNVSVGLSNTIFSANQFGRLSIRFLAGTSGCVLDSSNITSAATSITNFGNSNNYIAREVGYGGFTQFKQGADNSLDVVTTDQGSGDKYFSGNIIAGASKGFKWQNESGLIVAQGFLSGDKLQIGTSGAVNSLSLFTGGGSLYAYAGVGGALFLGANGTYRASINTDGNLVPFIDKTNSLGSPALRWVTAYVTTGVVNASDEQEKLQINNIDDFVLNAWEEVGFYKYKLNEEVQKRGKGAEWHFGLLAQEIKMVFEKNGLNPLTFGILVFDKESGRYGVRYEEALILEAALMRREIRRLKQYKQH